MCRLATLAAACVACLADAAPPPPLRLQPPRAPTVAAVTAARVLQDSVEEDTPRGCELPVDCKQVSATESNICGVQLESGVCYLIWEEYYVPSRPEDCTLVGPTSGAPAVFVSAGRERANLGWSNLAIYVTGRIQLNDVRLVTSNLTVEAAELNICKPSWSSYSCAIRGGGIYASTTVVISAGSNVSVSHTCADNEGGGVWTEGIVAVRDGSRLYIGNAESLMSDGGGLWATDLSVFGTARVDIQNTSAGHGGGFYVAGKVILNTGAAITVMHTKSLFSGGAFHADSLGVSGRSRLETYNTFAMDDGGGFYVKSTTYVSASSEVVVRNARSYKSGGGLATQWLIVESGTLAVSEANATDEGGCLHVTVRLELKEGAALDVSTCRASRCGGFSASHVKVIQASALKVNNSLAELFGGGFCGDWMEMHGGSTVQVSGTWAEITGGAFAIWGSDRFIEYGSAGQGGLSVTSGSRVELSGVGATMGFACYIGSYLKVLDNSSLSIAGHAYSKAEQQSEGGIESAGACYVGDYLLLADDARLTTNWETRGDTLVVRAGARLANSRLSIEGRPTNATSALRTPVLHLLDGSVLALSNFMGDTGLRVGPAYERWQLTQNATFLIESGSSVQITDSRAVAALLSLNITVFDKNSAVATHRETNLSHVRVGNCQGQFANVVGVGAAGVVDVNLSLGTPCMLEAAGSCPMDLLRFPESAHIHGLAVECASWEAGCELQMGAARDRLQIVSGSEHATCSKEATMVEGRTSQCRCDAGWDQGAYPPSSDSSADKVSREYCTTCAINTQYDADRHICRACPWYAPWSQGQSSRCLPWPVEEQGDQFIRMFLPAAALAMLTLWMAVMVSSPLYITDMTWAKYESLSMHKQKACCWQHSVAMGSESDDKGALLLTVQGPLVEYHGIRQFLWRILRYKVEGSGAWGVDYQPDKRNKYMIQAHGDRTIRLVGPGANLSRASSQGRLMVEHWRWALVVAVLLLAVVVLGPTWAVVVQYDRGHRVGHVFVSILYMVAMWALLAGAIFPLWLLSHDRYYRRTPLAELHQTYRRTICPEPYQGPDPKHPQYAGITAGVLAHTFNHYKSVVLDRNMHYVVANIVLPLTKPQQISFATMWGGRAVMYFVSHSWGTVHAEFVKTICNHAEGSAGDAWQSQTYWICSFSNNQWDISAALGETVMESAFARVLRGGLAKGVVMVLDAEVQPLHRVWCLFEVLVSHSEKLNIQYATAVGIIGDPRCTSVDVPLAIASRVETLRVAECESSSAEDKRKILGEVMARMGSLEAMDKHIGGLMAASISTGFAHTQKAVAKIVGKLSDPEDAGKTFAVPAEAVVVAP